METVYMLVLSLIKIILLFTHEVQHTNLPNVSGVFIVVETFDSKRTFNNLK